LGRVFRKSGLSENGKRRKRESLSRPRKRSLERELTSEGGKTGKKACKNGYKARAWEKG